MDPERLLLEVEDLLRTTPPRPTIQHDTPENNAWFGRAGALVTEWSVGHSVPFGINYSQVVGRNAVHADGALQKIMTLLHHTMECGVGSSLAIFKSQ